MTTQDSSAEFLTSREVAELLRVRPRKIYDMAARGEIPCRRVIGKLLFPRTEIDAWLACETTAPAALDTPSTEALVGGSGSGRLIGSSASPVTVVQPPLPTVIAGSHDPLLEWAIRESACMLATRFDGSLAGLVDLEQGLALGAGLHVFDQASGQWNIHCVERTAAAQDCVLVEWAQRQQGLIIAADQTRSIRAVSDLVGRPVVLRQATSGARLLLDGLLEEAGIALDRIHWVEPCARTESDAAAMVASGKAVAAPGLASMAARFSLGFLPTRLERFDLLLKRREYFGPGVQTLLAFARSSPFLAMATELGGYEVSGLGRVIWNAG